MEKLRGKPHRNIMLQVCADVKVSVQAAEINPVLVVVDLAMVPHGSTVHTKKKEY